MTHSLLTPSNKNAVHGLVVLSLAMGAATARADEPNPYYIGASETFTHDNNVYRIAGGPGDNYWSTNLLGGLDQSISRQHVAASASVAYNKYRDQTTLDNTSYGVNARWDWATIDQLSGTLSGSANQALANLSSTTGTNVLAKNLLKTDQVGGTANLGGESLLTLSAAYAHSSVSYSDSAFISSQSSGDTASLGLGIRPSPKSRFGVAYRGTRTVSPYGFVSTTGTLESNTTQGKNLDLTGDWRFTEKSSVSARASYTHQTNSASVAQNFNGPTGQISAQFAPTGKLNVSVSAGRDAGAYASFFNVGGTSATTQIFNASTSTQVTNTYALNLGYEVTSKVTLTATTQAAMSNIASTQPGVATDHDNAHISTLGVVYNMTRVWQLGCNVSHLNRIDSSIQSLNYHDSTGACTVQAKLQ